MLCAKDSPNPGSSESNSNWPQSLVDPDSSASHSSGPLAALPSALFHTHTKQNPTPYISHQGKSICYHLFCSFNKCFQTLRCQHGWSLASLKVVSPGMRVPLEQRPRTFRELISHFSVMFTGIKKRKEMSPTNPEKRQLPKNS